MHYVSQLWLELMSYVARFESPSRAADPWSPRKIPRRKFLPEEALAHLRQLGRRIQESASRATNSEFSACMHDPKPWNFAPLPEQTPQQIVEDEGPEPEPATRTLEEQEQSEDERINYSFSALEEGHFLDETYFEEYWEAQGLPGCCRWPPKKLKTRKEQKLEDTKKPKAKARPSPKDKNATSQRRRREKKVGPKKKKEASPGNGRRHGQMRVDVPDQGWRLGPEDLKELFRWPVEIASCLTEAPSANFDFRNI